MSSSAYSECPFLYETSGANFFLFPKRLLKMLKLYVGSSYCQCHVMLVIVRKLLLLRIIFAGHKVKGV